MTDSKDVPSEDVLTKIAFTRLSNLWTVKVEMVFVKFLHDILIQTLFGRVLASCRRLLGVL